MKRNHLAGIAVVAVGVALLAVLPRGEAQSLTGMPAAEAEGPTGAESGDTRSQNKSLVEELDFPGLVRENGLENWLSPPAGLLLGLILGWIAGMALRWIGHRMADRGWVRHQRIVVGLVGPLRLALAALGFWIGLANFKIQRDAPLDVFLTRTVWLAFSIAVVWYLANLVTMVEAAIERLRGKSQSALDRQLVPMIGTTLRVVVVMLGVLFVAQTVFDQNIGAWLAGLGIIGLGVSLAAQDSIKNFFGSITILFDQPFAVGERINYAGFDGIVEEIGFRSTKVRTLVGHLVTIPNSKIANEAVENIGRRPTIRRIINVTITYDTPREKIEEAVRILEEILDEEGIAEPIHPVINNEQLAPRVYFNDYNPDSLNLFVIYWYAPPVWWDYMAHCQKVNLRIFERFEAAGIEFAFPTQTLFVAGDEKRRLAIEMLGKGTEGDD